jgi:hypothetical protein
VIEADGGALCLIRADWAADDGVEYRPVHTPTSWHRSGSSPGSLDDVWERACEARSVQLRQIIWDQASVERCDAEIERLIPAGEAGGQTSAGRPMAVSIRSFSRWYEAYFGSTLTGLTDQRSLS